MRTQTRDEGGPGVVSEATLFQRAQAGCSDSLNVLMTRHDGLVQAVVRQQVLGDMPFTEALQLETLSHRSTPLRPLALSYPSIPLCTPLLLRNPSTVTL